jgi:hypothetical protein
MSVRCFFPHLLSECAIASAVSGVKLCTTVWLGKTGALITLAAVDALYVLSSVCSSLRLCTAADEGHLLLSCKLLSSSSRALLPLLLCSLLVNLLMRGIGPLVAD